MEVLGGDIGRNIFFVPLARAQNPTGTDSMGRDCQRDALCAQSVESRDSRADTGCVCAHRLQDSAD